MSGWQGTSVPVSLTRLNAKIAAFEQALEDLKAEVAAVPHGALGMPVVGEGEVNLAGLMRSRTTLDALVTLIGARTDDFGETWKGFTCLLRGDGKATEAEVKAAFHASLIVETYPQLGELWASAQISGAQVRQIGRLAAKIPIEHREEAVAVLAAHAPNLTDFELRQAARSLLNAVQPGWDEKTAEREEKESYLSIFKEMDGYGVRGHLTNEQVGWLRTGLDAHTAVQASDDHRSKSERQAEALVTVFRQYASSKVIPQLAMAKPQFVLRIDLLDALAIVNDAAPGDLPITEWGDRLDTITTRRMLSDADLTPVLVNNHNKHKDHKHKNDKNEQSDDHEQETLADVAFDAATAQRLKAELRILTKRRQSKEFATRYAPPVFLRLLTTPTEVIAVGRTTRTIDKPLRTAVTLRDLHCVVPGCDMPSHRCEIHHVKPWAKGGPTTIDNLATLCIRHHRTVENGTWQLRPRIDADGPGRYWIAEEKY